MELASLLSHLLEDTELAQEAIQGFVTKYKPILYTILRESFDMYKELAANAELFDTQATMKRNMYDAYIKSGFTPEQTMAFLLNTDIARAEFLRKLTASLPAQRQTA